MIDRENIVVFIYTRDPEPYFLLLKRSQNRGGFWQPVSGGIEQNEQPTQAIKREVFEETGISNIINILDFDLSYEYETTKNGVPMKMKDICFGAEVSQISPIYLSSEHSEYKWCKVDEVDIYLQWENIRLSFKKLIHSINS